MKINVVRIVTSVVFFGIGCFFLYFTQNPPEIMQYMESELWKAGTYVIGGFSWIASVYTLFYKEKK